LNWDLYWNKTKSTPLERLIQKAKSRWGYKKLLESVKLGVPGRSLEIGCGEARLSQILRTKGWHTTGLDILSFNPQIDEFVIGDIFQLPFGNKVFDICISCGLLEHFEGSSVQAILEEQHRVAKRVINWLPVKSGWWTAFQSIRKIMGADMPPCSYSHKKLHTGVVSFFGVLNYVYCDE